MVGYGCNGCCKAGSDYPLSKMISGWKTSFGCGPFHGGDLRLGCAGDLQFNYHSRELIFPYELVLNFSTSSCESNALHIPNIPVEFRSISPWCEIRATGSNCVVHCRFRWKVKHPSRKVEDKTALFAINVNRRPRRSSTTSIHSHHVVAVMATTIILIKAATPFTTQKFFGFKVS